MSDDSKRVDQYIAQAPEFARPILERVRKAFHKGCPEVEETIKWKCPHFMYKGMLGGMAAFKEHVSFGFWKSKRMDDPENLFGTGTGKKASMCNAHIKSLKDLPAQSVLVAYVRQAKKLNDDGVKKDSRVAKKKVVVPGIPPDLDNGVQEKHKSNELFRFAGAQPSSRIFGVDTPGQTSGNTRKTHCRNDQTLECQQTSQLEVRKKALNFHWHSKETNPRTRQYEMRFCWA